jgi:alpha-2-macroglobulin
MYRPGEEVHFKGWLRRIGAGPTGDVSLVAGAVSSVSYQVVDPQGNELGTGQADVNALGGFDFVFTIPEAVNLGYAQVYLNAQGNLTGLSSSSYYHSFQVQEFRRPEFEVTARNETTGPYFAGEHAVVAVAANYYAGGALPNAEVTWQVSTSPGSYSPPNWGDFTFGIWQPWWWSWRVYDEVGSFGPGGGSLYETFTGLTDAAGEHYLRLDFDSLPAPRPYSILAEATVMDVNRQAWTSSTTLLVHPADLYVGLRSDRYFVERGEPLKIDFIVTDLDGNPVADRPVTVTAARLEWKYRSGQWVEEEADVQTCNVGSTDEPVTCEFETPVGGSYRSPPRWIRWAAINQTQFNRWVSGGNSAPARKVEQEQVTLIPDKETYQPGDVAEILVQSPFSPAEGLLTVTRSGILYTERFRSKMGAPPCASRSKPGISPT